MILPNFLIIGAPKAGTTTIFNVLLQHPEVFLCKIKEVGFFWAYGQEVNIQGPGAGLLKHRIVNDSERYQALFEEAVGKKAIGEASVRYLAEPRSPALIHQWIPASKLIISLRQPAERAFSSFVRNLRDGLEPCTDFREALDQERSGLRQDWIFGRYLDKGFYSVALERYLQHFDRSQMHISLLEDLGDHPQRLMKDIFGFLQVDEAFEPDLSHRYNASGVIRNPLLRLLWTRTRPLQSAIRPLLPARLRQKTSEWVIKDVQKPVFPLDLRGELTAYYEQDILKLQDLIGRDLSHWLEPADSQKMEREEKIGLEEY